MNFNIMPTSLLRVAIVMLFLLHGVCFAFPSTSDSLHKLLNDPELPIRKRAMVYYELSKKSRDTSLDSSFDFAQKGLFLAEKSGYAEGAAFNLYQLGLIMIEWDSLNRAKYYLLRAKEHMDAITNPDIRKWIWGYLGLIYDYQADYDKAIYYNLLALNEAKQSGDSVNQAKFMNNLGIIYYRTGNYNKSLEFYRNALVIFRKSRNTENEVSPLNNIAMVHIDTRCFDSASFYLNKALGIVLKTRNYYHSSNLYDTYMDLFLKKKEYDSALHYALRSVGALDSLGSITLSKQYLYAESYSDLGLIYSELGKIPEALTHYRKARSIALKESMLETLAKTAEGLSLIFEKTGKPDSALFYQKLYTVYHDSLNLNTTRQKIINIEQEYQFKTRIKEEKTLRSNLELQHKTREFLYLLALAGILLVAMVLILFYLVQKNRTRHAELRQKALEFEKEKLNHMIEFKSKELATNVMHLVRRNELISSISARLQTAIDEIRDPAYNNTLNQIIRELDRSRSDEAWKEFEIRFQEVYGDFYQRLSACYPDLTRNELRLCAFLRLNMSTKEISSITYQTEHSIKIARYRLRKKLHLDRDDNVTSFLARF